MISLSLVSLSPSLVISSLISASHCVCKEDKMLAGLGDEASVRSLNGFRVTKASQL